GVEHRAFQPSRIGWYRIGAGRADNGVGTELTRRATTLTLSISADLIRMRLFSAHPTACGRFTNAAKAAFDRNPLGGKLNGFFVLSDDWTMKIEDKTALLTKLLTQRILVLDGAMGTMIQARKLGEADYRGAALCGLAG